MELDTNGALLHFLEDEGLSPFTLLKITPKPTAAGKKLPTTVVMEWGLEDLEHAGDRERFLAWRVTAEGVEVFRSEGELDRFEECNASLREAARIDLTLEAGGTVFLRCARLVVSDEPVERLRKGRPRPHHGELHFEVSAQSTTWGEVRAWLGIPPTLAQFRHRTTEQVREDVSTRDAKHTKLVDDSGNDVLWMSVEGSRFTVSRGKWARDELWNRVWSRVTSVPGLTRISSRDLVCPPATWPPSPPRKPAPQVWPNVYGVTCECEALTFGALRELFGLSATCAFVIEGEGAPEAHDLLTLGEAARGPRRSMSGVFQDAPNRPLVHVHADLTEGTLGLRRGRACDDATWQAVWRAPERLPGVRARSSRTTCSPPDPWPDAPPVR